MLEQTTSSDKNGDSVYAERDGHVGESRRTCSSSDSGRSSISSSQTSHCDESVDKKRIDQLFPKEKSSTLETHSTPSVQNEIVEDLDIYADVTLIPKSNNTIVLQPRETKALSKRSSRSKTGKTSRIRKSRNSSKSAECVDSRSNDTSSHLDENKAIENSLPSADLGPSEQPVVFAAKSLTEVTQSPDSNATIQAKHRSENSADMRRTRKSNTQNLITTSTVAERKGANANCGIVGFSSLLPPSSSKNFNEPSRPESTTEVHSLAQKRSSRSEDAMSRSAITSSHSSVGSSGQSKFGSTVDSESCEALVHSCTPQPDTTEQSPVSTSATSVSSKQSTRPNFNGSPSCVDIEKSGLKVSSYSSSSSPIPMSGNKLRTPSTGKRHPRASGSPNTTPNASVNKLHLTPRAIKSMPIRPLVPVEIQGNQSLGSNTTKKLWPDRNKRTPQNNAALLPNPLFQGTNCLCLQQLDSQNLLINQPYCWLLPGFNLSPYNQSSEMGHKTGMTNAKPVIHPIPTISHADASKLLPTAWPTARIQATPSLSEIDSYNPNGANAPAMNALQSSESKPSGGKVMHSQRILSNTKHSASELPSVYVQTEEVQCESSESVNPIDSNENPLDIKKPGSRLLEVNTNAPVDVDETKSRSLLTTGEITGNSSSTSGTIGSELPSVSRSFLLGPGVPDGNATGQVVPNVIAYTSTGEPCVMPANFVYFYTADGQLFAISNATMVYPNQSTLPNGEMGSGTDSAYSSPPAILSAQPLHEANLHSTYGTSHFDIPNGLLGAGPELSLEAGNTIAPIYDPVCSGQLALAGHVTTTYQPEVNQWPGCGLTIDHDNESTMNPPTQNQHQTRHILISTPNGNLPFQGPYALNGQYITGSSLSHPTSGSIMSCVERSGKESGSVSYNPTLRITPSQPTQQQQHGNSNKLGESTRQTKFGYETSSGLLGHAKTSGSILGDSKSMVLHPVSTFMSESGRAGSHNSGGHARQKKHSSKTNLYIRGLPSTFTEEQLHTLAPEPDLIRSVKLISGTDDEMYGFIDFTSNVAARAALLHIKSTNRELYVNFAYESEKDPQNVYITNIPETWTASNVEDLKKIFQPYGQIATAIVMTKRSNNFCTGAGFVRFVKAEDAQRAIEGIRNAQVKLDGGKGPLEVKLADRQKPPDDQSSSKSRPSKSTGEGTIITDASSDLPCDSFRQLNIQGGKKSTACLMNNDSIAAPLSLTINSVNSGARGAAPGLLSNATNFNLLNHLNNSNSLAIALQNALSNTPFAHSNLFLQNPLNPMNLSVPMLGESHSSQQSSLISYRTQTPQMANILAQPRGPRINTGLLHNPPIPTPTLFPNRNGIVPLARGSLDELTYNHAATISLSGTNAQPAILGHTLQSTGTWTPSPLIPGMFASM